MQEKTIEFGRIKINMKSFEIGDDLCLIVSGGDAPHIGCVTLSSPRPSLSDKDIISSTSSVLNRVGHKDDEVGRYISEKLSAKLNKHVAVICGIHVDNITQDELVELMESLNELISSIDNI